MLWEHSCVTTPGSSLLGVVGVWAQAILCAPVNGMTVVQHFEINSVPLKILISMDFIHALIDFFDPEGLHSKKNEEVRCLAVICPQYSYTHLNACHPARCTSTRLNVCL